LNIIDVGSNSQKNAYYKRIVSEEIKDVGFSRDKYFIVKGVSTDDFEQS
jgi:hypothetical protein